jgi:hypothetical protein
LREFHGTAKQKGFYIELANQSQRAEVTGSPLLNLGDAPFSGMPCLSRSLIEQSVQFVEVRCLRVGRGTDDLAAPLAVNLFLATWNVAFLQAHRIFRQTRNTEQAEAAFLAVVDSGTIGVKLQW